MCYYFLLSSCSSVKRKASNSSPLKIELAKSLSAVGKKKNPTFAKFWRNESRKVILLEIGGKSLIFHVMFCYILFSVWMQRIYRMININLCLQGAVHALENLGNISDEWWQIALR